MDTRSAQRVIFVSMVITVGIGGGTKLLKENKWPSPRYLMGVGLTFLILSALAEWEPQVAGPLSGAVVATSLFADGGHGILSWFDTGELSTAPPKPKSHTPAPKVAPPQLSPGTPSQGMPPIAGRTILIGPGAPVQVQVTP